MNAIKQVRDLRNQLAIQNEHIKLLKVNNDDLKRNNDDLKKNNDGLIKRNNELKERNKNQATLIQWMQRQIFGQKSERRLAQATNNQLTLGQILEETSEQPPIKKSVKSYERGLRKKKKLEGSVLEAGLCFDDSVPVEEVYVENPETKDLDPSTYDVISQKCTYRLAQMPASYVVIKYVRDVIKIKETGSLVNTPAPASVLEKSYADVSFLSGMLVDKFRYHLPLYRQHQRLKDSGIQINRGSLSNWVHRTVDLLEPIYHAQLSSILQSKVLSMDETPIKAGRKKGKMHQGYFWPVYGDQQEICFVFANTRKKSVVETILSKFCGTLMSDGYSAYQEYVKTRDDIEHALCWAHARRNFYNAQNVEQQRCGYVLDQIAKLYQIEKDLRNKEANAGRILMMRAQKSKVIVDALFMWMKKEMQDHALLQSNAFSKAAIYALKREKGLRVFLHNPEVVLDTNHLEREIRPVAIGRKNWLFCWTEVGARYAGIAQSLIASCRLYDVNPYTYFIDVLQRIDTHPARDVHLLTPRLWKKHFQENPMTSPVQF